MKRVYIINSRGEKEPFSLKKVYRSCRRSGASKTLSKEIAEKIKKMVYPGMETSEIFRLVKLFLSETSPNLLMRASLKEAMRKLGPSGFDFEKYIGEIFARNGFEVKMNQIISGFCASSYEIDFLAKKQNIVYLGECKYHYMPGERVDLKIALANYARFLDISKTPRFKNLNLKTIIVTNTKFTSEVVKYSKCMGLDLLGWKYPPKQGLENIIESSKLYPITILPSLKGYLKKVFAEKRIMLALDLLNVSPENLAKKLRLPLSQVEDLINEAEMLLE